MEPAETAVINVLTGMTAHCAEMQVSRCPTCSCDVMDVEILSMVVVLRTSAVKVSMESLQALSVQVTACPTWMFDVDDRFEIVVLLLVMVPVGWTSDVDTSGAGIMNPPFVLG